MDFEKNQTLAWNFNGYPYQEVKFCDTGFTWL